MLEFALFPGLQHGAEQDKTAHTHTHTHTTMCARRGLFDASPPPGACGS